MTTVGSGEPAARIGTICMVGLGRMGAPMARRLLAAGTDVRVHDRDLDGARSLAEAGAALCPRLEDGVTNADVVIVMVPAAAVEQLMAGPDGIIEHVGDGTLVIDGGNTDPAVSRRVCTRFAQGGVGYLDVGFSGGPSKASAGTLAVMVGGAAADFRRAESILRILGGDVVHVGASGAGHLAKALNHLVVALTSQAIGEALAIAESGGLEPAQWLRAASGGAASSWLMHRACTMAELDEFPGMDEWWQALGGRTQLSYSVEAAEQAGLAVPLTALSHELRKLSLAAPRSPSLEHYVRLTWTFANVIEPDR